MYTVNSLADLSNIIIPHFNNYPLLTLKIIYFFMFKEVVELMTKGERLTIQGLGKVVAFGASMNKGLYKARGFLLYYF